MENCYFTQINVESGNTNLPVYNQFVYHITSVSNPDATNRYFKALGCSAKIVNVKSGIACFCTTGQQVRDGVDTGVREITYPESTQNNYLVSNGEYDVIISNKYNCRLINSNASPLSVDNFEYSTKLTSITITGDAGDVSGNIEKLGLLILLDTLVVSTGNKATGSIENLSASQVSNGRVSGTLIITSGGHITLNGEIVPSGTTKTVKFGSSMVNPTADETAQGYQVV